MADLRLSTRGRPRLLGPMRRWLTLCVWLILLGGIVVVQYRPVRAFEHRRWLDYKRSIVSDDRPATRPATRAELLWYHLPRVLLVCVSVGFFISAKWLVPEKGTRTMIRAWGCFATFVALLCSFAMPCWFRLVLSMMD